MTSFWLCQGVLISGCSDNGLTEIKLNIDDICGKYIYERFDKYAGKAIIILNSNMTYYSKTEVPSIDFYDISYGTFVIRGHYCPVKISTFII